MHIPYLTEFLLVVFIHLLAVMSPGPDFALVMRNSLVYNRRAGIFTAIGLGMGILIHVTYSLLGIGFIISQSVVLFSVIKYVGAAYLLWIGWKAFRSKPISTVEEVSERTSGSSCSDIEVFKTGFITNVTNPKATLFFLALFTQVVSPKTPILVQIFYGLEMMVMTALWFALIAYTFSHHRVKGFLSGIKHHIDRVFGAILIALGLKVALTSTKGD